MYREGAVWTDRQSLGDFSACRCRKHVFEGRKRDRHAEFRAKSCLTLYWDPIHLPDKTVHTAKQTVRRKPMVQILLITWKAVPLQKSWSERYSKTLTTHWLLVLVLLIMWLVRDVPARAAKSLFLWKGPRPNLHIPSPLVRLSAQTCISGIDLQIKMMILATACAEIPQKSHKRCAELLSECRSGVQNRWRNSYLRDT